MSDACPGVLRLHEAADGRLARVRLPGGHIDARGLRGVAAAARLGNSIVELTSRASLQLRGLSDAVAAEAASVLTDAGLLPAPAHERVRNIIASPVAGRHPDSVAPTDAVVAELDRRLCADPATIALSGRHLFAVDDGAGLVGRAADVTLVATGPDSFRVGSFAGPPAAAIDAALGLALSGSVGSVPEVALGGHLRLGALLQADGRVALTVLPRLARLGPDQLDALAELSDDVRLSVRRTLTLVDVAPERADTVAARLRALELIDDDGSGWHGLTACAGLGACARAERDVRAAASRRAAERRGTDPPEHFAACDRNCGRPPDAEVHQ